MTYEHRPGSGPASPDLEDFQPEICDKCPKTDCDEPCIAYADLVEKQHEQGMKEADGQYKDYLSLKYTERRIQ